MSAGGLCTKQYGAMVNYQRSLISEAAVAPSEFLLPLPIIENPFQSDSINEGFEIGVLLFGGAWERTGNTSPSVPPEPRSTSKNT